MIKALGTIFVLTILMSSVIGCELAESVESQTTDSTLEPIGLPTQIISNQDAVVTKEVKMEQAASLDLPDTLVYTVVFSPDSRSLITGDIKGEVLIWQRDGWVKKTIVPAKSSAEIDPETEKLFGGSLSVSPAGDILVAAYGEDGRVSGHDRDGVELFNFSFGAPIYSQAISPNGRLLAIGGVKNDVIIFDLEKRQQIADLISDHEYISNMVFDPGGDTLLVCYERPGNIIKFWNTVTWKESGSFSHTTDRFDYHDIVFSPDDKMLVIASNEDVEIKFLDLTTNLFVRELPQHNRGVYQIAFSPDGSLMASAADDFTLRFWDVQTGALIKTLQTGYEVGAVTFSPDGTLIAFAVWGEGVQVWSLIK